MVFNADEMLKMCKRKSEKLYHKCGDLKEAAKEKRIPSDYSDEILELVVQVDEFLKTDLPNLKELIRFYNNVKKGIEENVRPAVTDDDVTTTYASTVYQMDLLQERVDEFQSQLLPRYIL